MELTAKGTTLKVSDIIPEGHHVTLKTKDDSYKFTWEEYGNKT